MKHARPGPYFVCPSLRGYPAAFDMLSEWKLRVKGGADGSDALREGALLGGDSAAPRGDVAVGDNEEGGQL